MLSRIEFGQNLPALGLAADQLEDFALFLWRGKMDDDLGNVGRMHPAQHFCQIGDRASSQQTLDGQQHDIGLGLPSIGLLPSMRRATHLCPRRGVSARGERTSGSFSSRLHH